MDLFYRLTFDKWLSPLQSLLTYELLVMTEVIRLSRSEFISSRLHSPQPSALVSISHHQVWPPFPPFSFFGPFLLYSGDLEENAALPTGFLFTQLSFIYFD